MEQRKIMIVEESTTQRAMLRDMVLREGYKVVESVSGAEATERMHEKDIDAVLVNWELVDTTGPELCHQWHATGEFDLVPLLIITSYDDANHLRDALDAGATDFIRKPPDQVELFARLRLALRMREFGVRLHEGSIRDSLTGLFNRRHVQDELVRHCESARRYGESFSVAMIDIDFFKKVNDTYGHPMGDAILKQMADYFVRRLRKTDVVGRIGGEEFLVILHGTPLAQVELTLEAVRRGMAELRFGTEETVVNVTFSTGVSTWSKERADAHTLIERADECLYASKQAGRNRVTATP
jgi:diguanylate cyclase (GGDEF)-like protein